MNRTHVFSMGEFYHLYNRGTDKRHIFNDIHDYHRFMLLLYLCNQNEKIDLQTIFREGRSFAELFTLPRAKPIVAIGAWVLMPNHFHILVKEIVPGGITTFMRKVNTGYSMYFNKKHNRTGNLFQGKFKSQQANTDNHLKYLFAYIHLNPVKLIESEHKWKELGIKDMKNVQKFLTEYEYSSLSSYLDTDARYEKIIQKDVFPNYFPEQGSIWKDLLEWLNFKELNEPVKLQPSPESDEK